MLAELLNDFALRRACELALSKAPQLIRDTRRQRHGFVPFDFIIVAREESGEYFKIVWHIGYSGEKTISTHILAEFFRLAHKKPIRWVSHKSTKSCQFKSSQGSFCFKFASVVCSICSIARDN